MRASRLAAQAVVALLVILVSVRTSLAADPHDTHDGPVQCFAFGGVSEVFSGSDLFRGNLYTVVREQTLNETRIRLDFTGPATIFFYVLEAAVQTGPYTVLSESIVMTSGIGEAMYASGPIDVALRVDRFYAVGIAWSGTTLQYFRDPALLPRAWALGRVEASAASNGIVPPISGAFTPTFLPPTAEYAIELCFDDVTVVPPVNDDCAAALPLSVGDAVAGDLSAASGDGSASCGASGGHADVWYRIEAAADGVLTVTTCGTHDTPAPDQGMDTVLSVHAGCPGVSGNELTCNDDWPDGALPAACAGADGGARRDAAVRLCATAGQAYLVRVSHAPSALADGHFLIQADLDRCPADLDGSGTVNALDLLPVLGAWGTCVTPCPADLTCDANVNVFDLLEVLDAWGPCPAAPPACPSPSPCVGCCTECGGAGSGCICVEADLPGGALCVDANVSCVGLVPCPGGTGDCPPGQICATSSCCGDICIPPGAFCGAGDARSSPPPGTPTLGGE